MCSFVKLAKFIVCIFLVNFVTFLCVKFDMRIFTVILLRANKLTGPRGRSATIIYGKSDSVTHEFVRLFNLYAFRGHSWPPFINQTKPFRLNILY